MWPPKRRLALSRHHPPVSVAELAVQLELELMFHGNTAFARRLKRALDAAYQAGKKSSTSQKQITSSNQKITGSRAD